MGGKEGSNLDTLEITTDTNGLLFLKMVSKPQPCIRVLIVDDHDLTRLSLKVLFASQKNVERVSLASNGQEAIELAKQHPPDVIILDLQMPVMDGLSAASQLKYLAPYAQIIAYSSVEDPQTEVMLLTAPIDAFCRKESATDALVELVNQLGQRSLSYR